MKPESGLRLLVWVLGTTLWLACSFVGAATLGVASLDGLAVRRMSDQDLAECVANPHLDCNPQGWEHRLLIGLALLAVAAVLTIVGVRRLLQRRRDP